MNIFSVFTIQKTYLYLFFTFMAFLQLIIIFFNKIKKFVVSFSMFSQLLEMKMKQKVLEIFLGLNQII
jgi:hypothetical protein